MSCLFNSFSYFFKQSSYDIRQSICNYLQENKPIIDGLDTHFILGLENSSANSYVSRMRATSTWGGAIEIQAACNIWNVQIIVHNIRDHNGNKINFLPINNKFKNTINITWSGGHYEPVRSNN
jgi:prephenate dehydratase